MIQWVIDEKLAIDGHAHYEIELYRSQVLILIGEAKVELDVMLEVTVREYRI
jgi:hypothetical protein